MIKKLLLLTTIAVGVLAFVAGPVSAQYPEDSNASVDDTSVLAGGAINITGQCFGDDVVDVYFGDDLIGSLPVDADGTFSGPVTVPSGTAPGSYTLEAHCGDEVLSITITVTAAGVVTPPASDPGNGALARTGTEVDGLLKVGGGLLLAGAAALLFTTKRRTAA